MYDDLGLFQRFCFFGSREVLEQSMSLIICSISHRQRVRLLLLVAVAVLVCFIVLFLELFVCFFLHFMVYSEETVTEAF